MNPVVSIIIPTFRHDNYILSTLESVFAQSFTSYEIIIINDGSPDDTAAFLKPLADAGRIRYFEQRNSGQASARNHGVAEARGKYLAFLDDDDLWPPDKLKWQVAHLDSRDKCVLVYGLGRNLGSEDDIFPAYEAPSGDVRRRFAEENHIRSPGVTLIRTEALRAVGGFDEAIWGVDDWDLYLRLACVGEFSFAPQLALFYRMHESNASRDILRLYKNALLLCEKHKQLFSTLGLRAGMPPLMQRYFENGCITEAIRARELGDKDHARKLWLAAIRLNLTACCKRYFVKEFLHAFAPPWTNVTPVLTSRSLNPDAKARTT